MEQWVRSGHQLSCVPSSEPGSEKFIKPMDRSEVWPIPIFEPMPKDGSGEKNFIESVNASNVTIKIIIIIIIIVKGWQGAKTRIKEKKNFFNTLKHMYPNLKRGNNVFIYTNKDISWPKGDLGSSVSNYYHHQSFFLANGNPHSINIKQHQRNLEYHYHFHLKLK